MQRPVWYRLSAPVEQRPISYVGGERPVRTDGFMWFSYGAMGAFFAAQIGLLVWLDLVR